MLIQCECPSSIIHLCTSVTVIKLLYLPAVKNILTIARVTTGQPPLTQRRMVGLILYKELFIFLQARMEPHRIMNSYHWNEKSRFFEWTAKQHLWTDRFCSFASFFCFFFLSFFLIYRCFHTLVRNGRTSCVSIRHHFLCSGLWL